MLFPYLACPWFLKPQSPLFRLCIIAIKLMKIVAATCLRQNSRSTVLFEPLDSSLPARLLASPALGWVERRTAYAPIVNVGSTDVLLYPHTVVGILAEVSIVSLPAGVNWVPLCVSTVVTQSVSGSVLDQIDVLDLSPLPDVEQAKVRSLLLYVYRQLNIKTRKDAFPLPCIKESLHALTGAHWFSTMDLVSGYKQVQVDKADQPKQHFAPHLASLNGTAWFLVSATPSRD